MEYANLKDMYTYSGQSNLKFPKGEPNGCGNSIYLLTPNESSNSYILGSDFVKFKESMYKSYYIDHKYKEKIGYETINEMIAGDLNSQFKGPKNGVSKVQPAALLRTMASNKNLIVDLGHWIKLWFANYRFKTLRESCGDFWDFINAKISTIESMATEERKKILYVPLEEWSLTNMEFKVTNLNNPVVIILCTAYKFPDICEKLKGLEIVFVDLRTKQFLKMDGSSIDKSNYTKMLAQVKKLSALKEVEIEEPEEEDHTNETAAHMSKDKEELTKMITQKINAELMKNVQAGIDITEDDREPELISDEDKEAISDTVDEVVDNADDSDTPEEVAETVEKEVKRKVFMSKFTPDRSKSQVKKIEQLTSKQFEVLSTQNADVMESKVIDKVDLTGVVDCISKTITTNNFIKLDESYNKKKLQTDINNAVAQLSKCDYPIYITNVIEEDTSDPLNLKKTLTYEMEDMDGRKMKIKFDVPIILEGSYIWLNGGKKIIGHQQLLKPIVKSGPAEVQLVTFKGKAFMRRTGKSDLLTAKMKAYIISNEKKFGVKFGNMYLKNGTIPSTLEIDTFAKNISEFHIGDNVFTFDFHKINDRLKDHKVNMGHYDSTKDILVGYNRRTKHALYIPQGESFTQYLMTFMQDEDIKAMAKVKARGSLMYTTIKVLCKEFPLIYVMLFCEGFTSVMEKSKIDYMTVEHKEAKKYDPNKWGMIKCLDKTILWERYPMRNSLLMNGFSKIDVSMYTVEELDSKETYIDMMPQFSNYTNTVFNLDHWKMFVLDEVTIEILKDFNYPTDLIEVLAYCNSLLTTNAFLDINNEENLRIRSTEVIAEFVYKEIAMAYNQYRKSMHTRTKKNVSIKQDAVIKALTTGLATLDEASDLNPVLELEKRRSVTYKGADGINQERALSLARRRYDKSMVGICGIVSSPDSKVGINRQLTLNPSITSTRGYLQVTDMEDVDKLSYDRLLTPSELLTPMSVTHDDAQRSAMAFKQSQYTIPVMNATPVLVGNKVEAVVPQHLSSAFSKVAKQDGQVIDEKDGVYVVKYKDGTYDSFDINETVVRNAASGFYLTAKMDTNLKVGSKVKQNQVLAWNNRFFTKNSNDLSASMNIGVFAKLAIMPQYDQYEDSTPITKKLSDQMASEIVIGKKKFIPAHANIRNMVKVGDYVQTGDPLCVYDLTSGDAEIDKFISGYGADLKEEILEATASAIPSKYSGTVTKIEISSTVPVEDLSPSIQDIVKRYHNKIDKKNKFLAKYSNPDDSKYYKCGQILSESTDIVIANKQGKVKGERAEEGIIVTFYVKFIDRMKKGDKLAMYAALKGIDSHVLKEGEEQYSEFRPKEEISTSIAPGALLARKTPSLILIMFANKCLVECKRKMKAAFYETPFKDTY